MIVYWNPKTGKAWCADPLCLPARALGGGFTLITGEDLSDNREGRWPLCDSCVEPLLTGDASAGSANGAVVGALTS